MKFYITLLAFVASAMSESNFDLLKAGNDRFTAKMLQEMVKENQCKSVVLSGFSVLNPLAQLSLASVGESHDEILKAIGLPNDDVVKEQFTNVTKQLKSLKGIEVNLASKIYVRKNETLNERFANITSYVFNSEAQNIEFAVSYYAAREINTWVENNTNHRIKDLVSPYLLDSHTAAVLVSAMYFKGNWSKVFDVGSTHERDFHVSKYKTITVSLMYQRNNFKYGESKELDAKLLEMTYTGDQSSLLIILPNQIDGISALVDKLKDPATVSKAVENMQSNEVDVEVPRFKIETSTDLKNILNNMNVVKLFEPSKARLYKMLKGKSDLFLSEAIQKAYIDVNENGSQAAAANEFFITAGMSPGGDPRSKPKEFKADHPFYFALQINNLVTFNGIFVE